MGKSREQMDRHNARRRAKTKTDVSAEIAIVYEKPLEEWDDEELVRGRPRASDGTFRGARPTWITPAVQAERQRRLRQLMSDELGTFAADALRTIHAVMTDDRVDDFGKPVVSASVRLDAGKYLVDQFMGKAVAQIDVTAHNPLQDLLAGILVNPDGQPAHSVVEGEVVDDALEDYDGPTLRPSPS
ncbi:hypothetical protein [Pseudonocardia dioxanivorans]|uniref:hypothetical protein n=1 Tax=Pseudonocardia dioxanivorans TaxID=240495 RepID=UPI000CD07D1F|nr:hypothetical protein [Pseudonocardia dioxanivorans]